MISKAMTKALNEQVNAELYSAYIYLAMSSYASYAGLKGAATWFGLQAKEETIHAHKIYDYVNSQGQHAELKAIDKPPAKFEGLKDMFQQTLEHEKLITKRINALVERAVKAKDHATEIFLQWFVSEQVEEEESVNEILTRLKLAGDKGPGLFMLDRELGMRAAK